MLLRKSEQSDPESSHWANIDKQEFAKANFAVPCLVNVTDVLLIASFNNGRYSNSSL